MISYNTQMGGFKSIIRLAIFFPKDRNMEIHRMHLVNTTSPSLLCTILINCASMDQKWSLLYTDRVIQVL